MRKAQGGIAAARCTGILRARSSYVRNRCLNSSSLSRRPFLLFPYYSSSFLCGMLLCCRASPSHVSASRDIVQVRGATRPVIAGSTELCRPDWHPMVVSPRRHETVGREPHSVLSIYTHARTQHAARTHARTHRDSRPKRGTRPQCSCPGNFSAVPPRTCQTVLQCCGAQIGACEN